MNRFKKSGVLFGILAVVSIATLSLTRYEKKQEQIKSNGEIILSIPRDTVTKLSWKYAEESGLAFHKTEESWHYDEDDQFQADEEKDNSILSVFKAFGVSFIIENVDDYNQYGLEKPEMTLHIETEETAYTIRLGDFSKIDEQRYVDIGDGNVYLVSEDPMDHVSPALSNMILNDDTPGFENVESIRLEGSENYTIQRLEDTAYSYSENDVFFTQENGKYLPLDPYAVNTYLNTITILDLMNYVRYNATEEELQACGMDDPELSITVNYTQTDQASENGEQFPTPVLSTSAEVRKNWPLHKKQ